MQFVRQLWNRLGEWLASRRNPPAPVAVSDFTSYLPSVSRDVSAHGVRFFSLCGTCGERMETNATLCDDCARKRTGFSI